MTSANFITRHPFLAEVIRQFRLLDRSEIYQNLSDESLLDRLLIPPNSDCQIWGDRDVDPLSKMRLWAFYGAVTAEVERETGKLAQLFVNLSRCGLSSVLVSCGKLLVVFDLIQQVNCFGFESAEQLIEAGEKIAKAAIFKTKQHFD
jgi:probable nitrogen fixation protein